MSPTSSPQDAGEIPLSAATPRQLLDAFIAHAEKLGALPPKPRRKSRHWKQVLDQQQVEQIRVRYQAGVITQAQLAKEYGVTKAHVCRVINGKVWTAEGTRGSADSNAVLDGQRIVSLLERIARNLELPRRPPAPQKRPAACPRPAPRPASEATQEPHRAIPKSLADAMVERGYWTPEYAEARVTGGTVPAGIRQSPAN